MTMNVFAYTPAEPAPSYISANVRDATGVEITVRSKRTEFGYGAEASITVPLEQVDAFIEGLRIARSRLIDEASYADLRASGGAVGAP